MPKRYGDEELAQAVSDVKNGMSSVYRASKVYNIPKSTLLDKIKERYKNDQAGRPTILTKAEEELIEKWVLGMADKGFPVTKENLLNSVNKFVLELQRPNSFKNGIPGNHWYEGFMARHPSIAKRITQTLVHARSNVDESKLRAWFQKVHEFFVKNNLTDVLEDPSRIFNVDESAFFLCPKGDAVLARKGSKAVYSRSGNDEKECMTVLMGASASGKILPPLALYSFKRLPRSILDKFPKNWSFGKTDSGWMTAESFYEYIANVFNPFLQKENIKKPVVLFLDGHVSHLSLQVCEFEQKNEIILTALLPHSTHILQPMDVSVFRPLKAEWSKDVRNWRMENNGSRLKKEDFAPILRNTIEKSMKGDTIRNGFRKCGLYPFNANAIDYGSFLKHTDTTAVRLPLTPPTTPRNAPVGENREFIEMFESRLGQEKLKCFQESPVVWTGDVKDEHLFYFWKSLSSQDSSILPLFGNSTLNANICLEENLTFDFDNISFNENHAAENGEIQYVLQDLVTPTPEKNEDEEIQYVLQSFISPTPEKNEGEEIQFVLESLTSPTPEKSAKEGEIENTYQETPIQIPQNTKTDEWPTPFKKTFVWPETNSQASTSENKVSKRVVPTVAIAEEYITHLRRLDEEKQRKKEQIDEKRKIREMKKANANEKQKKKKETTISKGDYVVFMYELEKYPGVIIEKKSGKKYKIKSMEMSHVNKGEVLWRWPEIDDILVYDERDIVRKIGCPKEIGKSGNFEIQML